MPENMLPKQRMLNEVARTLNPSSPLQHPLSSMRNVFSGSTVMKVTNYSIALRTTAITMSRCGMISQYHSLGHRHECSTDKALRAIELRRLAGRARSWPVSRVYAMMDIIGAPDLMADAECMMVGCSVLRNLGIDSFVIESTTKT